MPVKRQPMDNVSYDNLKEWNDLITHPCFGKLNEYLASRVKMYNQLFIREGHENTPESIIRLKDALSRQDELIKLLRYFNGKRESKLREDTQRNTTAPKGE